MIDSQLKNLNVELRTGNNESRGEEMNDLTLYSLIICNLEFYCSRVGEKHQRGRNKNTNPGLEKYPPYLRHGIIHFFVGSLAACSKCSHPSDLLESFFFEIYMHCYSKRAFLSPVL